MPLAQRRAALAAGLDAYDRGDFFLAHELLEPAWMGARNLAERELLQGLIKLAAAFVHEVRRNPAGVAKNLRGSLARVEAGLAAGDALGVDADALAASIRERLHRLERETIPRTAVDATTSNAAAIAIPRRAARGAPRPRARSANDRSGAS